MNTVSDTLLPHRKDRLMLVLALLYGIVFDVLFYEKAPGISHPLFLILLYGYFYWMLKEKAKLHDHAGLWMLIPILMLSLSYAAFSNELFRVLNGLAVPAMIAAHTTIVYGESKRKWHDPRILLDIISQVTAGSIRQLPQPVKVMLDSFQSRLSASRYKGAAKVAVGLLIAAPLLVIVISLLASADRMFGRMLDELPNLLAHMDVGLYVSHGMCILLIALSLFCYTRGLLYPQKPVRSEEEKTVRAEPLRLDPIVTVTVLLAINAVYVLFAVVQFSYLFGGGEGLLPDGVTYAEYARRGFMELVVVTVINFTVLMAVLHCVRKEGVLLHRIIKGLLGLLIGCTGVMLCSAYYRLWMYEEAYGYSYIRLLVHAFMVFLLELFIIAGYKLCREAVSLTKPYIIVAIAAYVIVNYINIDVIIAKNNIARYEETGKIDTYYLTRLSYDAVPQLIKLYQAHPELPHLRDNLLAIKSRVMEPVPWPSFNWSLYRAKKAFSEADLE
jgi:hypothetical protein